MSNIFRIGNKYPDTVNVVIEIPMNSDPVKYEIDHDTGALFVDRFLNVAMHYPANYGFIPETLGGDGDPLDVLVITRFPVSASSVIPSRPIGVLIMEDEKGMDEKIIALPDFKIDPSYENIKDIKDLDQFILDKISHFFERYKDLEKNKWVKIIGFKGSEEAKSLISKFVKKD